MGGLKPIPFKKCKKLLCFLPANKLVLVKAELVILHIEIGSIDITHETLFRLACLDDTEPGEVDRFCALV